MRVGDWAIFINKVVLNLVVWLWVLISWVEQHVIKKIVSSAISIDIGVDCLYDVGVW